MAVMLDLPFSHLNDEEFNLVLYEFANGSVSFDEDRLSSLVFNPLLFDYNNNLTMWADLDADTNYYSQASLSCDYFTEQSLNDLLATSVSQIYNHFSIFHLNISLKSISPNLDNLQNLLSTIKHRFSVVGISETWLHQDQHNVNIDGYNFVYNHRPDRVGGGVGLYVANDFQFICVLT